MKKRYILIDSENVQNRLFEVLENTNKHDKVLIFYTVHHSGRLDEYLKMKMGNKSVEFIECMTGSNALDLQLCGVLSFLIQKHPKKTFLLYSNDKGYLAAVRHWQKMGVDVQLVTMLNSSGEVFSFNTGRKKRKKKKSNKNSDNTADKQNVSTAKESQSSDTAEAPQKSVSEQNPDEVQKTESSSTIKIPQDAVKAIDEPLSVSDTAALPVDQSEKASDTMPDDQIDTQEQYSKMVKENDMGLSQAEFIKGVCHSVRASDLAMISRVLSLGLEAQEAKSVYAQFKHDEAYRNEMGKLYYPTKSMRLKTLISTALKLNELDDSTADQICEIIHTNGTSNLQQLYHSFIKQIPGKLSERQMIYKVIKPYISVVNAL